MTVLVPILHHLLRPRADLPWGRWWPDRVAGAIIRIWRLGLGLRMLDLRQMVTTPVLGRGPGWSRSSSWRNGRRPRRAPLWTRRRAHSRSLIQLRVHVTWSRCTVLVRHTGRLTIVAEQLQPGLDMHIGRIQVCCALVGIQSIGGLVVARFILKPIIRPLRHTNVVWRANLPTCQDRTKLRRCMDSCGWPGSMRRGHHDTD